MTTTLPATLRAPFSSGGASAIDAQLANRLLGLALGAGGDYADIYFEFRVSADYVLEEESVKTLGRGITLGLGVRVTKGDATGYAYTEDLSWEKMAHAAKTAGQIAMGGGHTPVDVGSITPVKAPSFYAVPTPSLVVPAVDKLALLRAADKAARAFDPRIVNFRARFHSDAWIEHKLRQLNLRNARRIERTIVDLQGLFIKVGQLISIMTNFLPEEFRRELEGLQDAVPPRPYVDIEARIREELGKSPEELFAHIERRPIASASIGQVHIARMHDGTKVAVKVQYPDIEEIVRRDLNTLRRIFKIVEWFIPNGLRTSSAIASAYGFPVISSAR